MNRQQRRQMKKQGMEVPKSPTYVLNEDNIKKMKKDIYDDAVGTAMTLLLSIPVMVGVQKYEWTTEEVETFCNDLLDEYERFDSGNMTLEEYQTFVYEQCGVRFERK